jgi:Family of unknown function (DUF5989)
MAEESSSGGGLLGFLWRNKIWWLTPAIAVLLLTGLLLYFGRSSATSPFTYTLF